MMTIFGAVLLRSMLLAPHEMPALRPEIFTVGTDHSGISLNERLEIVVSRLSLGTQTIWGL